MGEISISWSPRLVPLAPCACVARGQVARALGRALLEWDPARLGEVKACAGDDVLVVLAEAEKLPWVDGVVYLGRDPAAPHLLLPTALTPGVPVDLFARALAARLPEAAQSGAVIPSGKRELVCVRVAGATVIARESLERWMAGA